MSVPHEDEPAALDQVLILAPYRRDAEYMGRLLAEHDIAVVPCTAGDLATHLATGPGVLVTTHEALTPALIVMIADYLRIQPPWSEMPIVVLLDRASPNARIRATLETAWLRSRQLFYQRPLAPVELVSGVQSALLARLRQRDVRDHIDREVELRRELNHRVKNILASVSSIFEMTRRGADDVDALAEDFGARLHALSRVHSAVFQAEGETISIAEIAALTFDPYRQMGISRIEAHGPPVTLRRDAGTTLALCLHELTTNAIKYGALSRPEGRVRFRWEILADLRPDLSMEWEEKGGPAVVAPARSGYGTRYLRAALAGLLGGKPDIDFAADGLRCAVQGPLSRVAGNPEDGGGVSGA
ncbi:sensor histidine kinase [Sphingomonas sp. JC676]|uniref:sensor histidine kinase n=1 Tax=Sphingomonas sp. JC676 TaxID=2768065 RepID=UPI001657FCF8|nr:sensor histidine kinase [Sphingomonas sp. JC676]MBC9033714.1 sensor histidine kinase [Sphingomonas sp. JC676]